MKTASLSLAVLVLALGCSNDRPITKPPTGGAGNLTLALATPRTDDAALFFELHGPGITALTPTNSAVHLFADSSGTSLRGAVFGVLTNGALITFHVPDTTLRSSYTAAILDVASDSNALRSDLTGYALRIAP